MKKNLAAFASGVLFAIGLAVSGMTRPSKVLGFLDVAGAWDPSLAFVMVGAIGVHFVLRKLVMKRSAPLFDTTFYMPSAKGITSALVVGAALFGVGWGLSGFCPGPALVTFGGGLRSSFVFVIGMVLGVALERITKAMSQV